MQTDVLLQAIEKVNNGEILLDRAMVGRIFKKQQVQIHNSHLSKTKQAFLITKERKSVALIVSNSGASNKEIENMLFMSEHCLRNHSTSI